MRHPAGAHNFASLCQATRPRGAYSSITGQDARSESVSACSFYLGAQPPNTGVTDADRWLRYLLPALKQKFALLRSPASWNALASIRS